MSARRIRLALCLHDGTPLGLTPALDFADGTWWTDAAALVSAAREAWGLEVVILRLAETVKSGGLHHQIYAAEVAAEPVLALDPVDATLFADEPLRMPWAKPGGPAAQLDWATTALAASGVRVTGAPVQVRSWNLSSLWRLPTDAGSAWLKAVPPFFAHEGAVLEALAGHPVPRVIARADGVTLLADIPGVDLYEPSLPDALRMIDLLVAMQSDVERSSLPDLPSWSVADLGPGAQRALDATPELSQEHRRTVQRIIDGLGSTARAVEDCGIPETLVHGDFHPGNLRGTAGSLTLLDWGDSGWGHPLHDVPAFVQRMDATASAAATAHWMEAWRTAAPGSDPERALALLEPVGALRQALIYQLFLDNIEPVERVYHASDPLPWLRKAAELAA
ncbi:hypothetical protein GCM10009775_31740 [Microbacterium aoyamense]|uniref:Aminoglycoside phosphotransferase domain-containing protein n=1 Tax=Microbacterium aoyamense TaxID=344166 RepID=A0ABP5B8V8_9MICO|nr:aminoglycoside phosphotransferase family protein [Microbacterium aoyamense]